MIFSTRNKLIMIIITILIIVIIIIKIIIKIIIIIIIKKIIITCIIFFINITENYLCMHRGMIEKEIELFLLTEISIYLS